MVWKRSKEYFNQNKLLGTYIFCCFETEKDLLVSGLCPIQFKLDIYLQRSTRLMAQEWYSYRNTFVHINQLRNYTFQKEGRCQIKKEKEFSAVATSLGNSLPKICLVTDIYIFLYKREISQVKDVFKQRPLSLLSMVLLSSIFKVYLYIWLCIFYSIFYYI